MSHSVFSFYICEDHKDIFGLQFPNVNYKNNCHQHCDCEDGAGYLMLDGENQLIDFYLADWVRANIQRGEYSFTTKTVLDNLYDRQDHKVIVSSITEKSKSKL